ncbi:hypothetical protein [Niveispirillum sp. BGYR6]|uniref:hypothetical protein n=1 Tax=Niveispirillum sp. BGYR6 TaxID=2971249 RepID=UPI0022B9611C|nr:hypothetical protein [Niveispirillum sp. BGYR6]MDG5496996.1 hypothetical protein [Niveispirillum sp. BGYR6]
MSTALSWPPAVPQNVNITSAQIAEMKLLEIPLYYIPCQSNGETYYKVGIVVNVAVNNGSAQGSQSSCLYEFDTGGPGFWANGSNFKGFQSGSYDTAIQYESGITYFAQSTECQISFYLSGSNNQTPSISINMGLVGESYVTGQESINTPHSKFESNVDDDNNLFPIYNYFQGDFGVSLSSLQKCNVPSQYSGEFTPLLGALSQIIQNNVNGFVIDLANLTELPQNPYLGSIPITLPSETKVGRLILGAVAPLIEYFPQVFKLQNKGQFTPETQSEKQNSYPIYSPQLLCGNAYTAQNDIPNIILTKEITQAAVAVTLDTGTPSILFDQGTNMQISANQFPDNTEIALTVGGEGDDEGTPMPILYLTNPKPGDAPNNINMSTSAGGLGNINTGIYPFTQFPILFMIGTEPNAPGLIAFPAASTTVSG